MAYLPPSVPSVASPHLEASEQLLDARQQLQTHRRLITVLREVGVHGCLHRRQLGHCLRGAAVIKCGVTVLVTVTVTAHAACDNTTHAGTTHRISSVSEHQK